VLVAAWARMSLIWSLAVALPVPRTRSSRNSCARRHSRVR
jgi:hypothetical protein